MMLLVRESVLQVIFLLLSAVLWWWRGGGLISVMAYYHCRLLVHANQSCVQPLAGGKRGLCLKEDMLGVSCADKHFVVVSK